MNTRNFMIALAAIALAVPATASTQRTAEQATKQAAQSQPTKSKAQLYCLTYDYLVGSRTRQQECKTKAQWKDEGIDVDHPDADSRG